MTNDFDFLTGHFDVHHRQLKKPLTGSDEWEEYDGTTTGHTFFLGAISIDEMRFPHTGSFGMSIRIFDPKAEEWSVYWVNSRTGRLQAPVRGRWVDGVSLLYGEDEHDGRPVLANYRWSDVTETTARWEQAYSVDGGETWETNWIMEFTRRESEPPPLDVPEVTGDFEARPGNPTGR